MFDWTAAHYAALDYFTLNPSPLGHLANPVPPPASPMHALRRCDNTFVQLLTLLLTLAPRRFVFDLFEAAGYSASPEPLAMAVQDGGGWPARADILFAGAKHDLAIICRPFAELQDDELAACLPARATRKDQAVLWLTSGDAGRADVAAGRPHGDIAVLRADFSLLLGLLRRHADEAGDGDGIGRRLYLGLAAEIEARRLVV